MWTRPVRRGIGRRAAAVVAGVVSLALLASGCTSESSQASSRSTVSIPSEPPADETVAELESAVTHAMDAAGATGAIAAVWIPWAGAWVEGIGTTGPGSDEPVTPEMHFRIGEVTRAMTCDVLFQVAEGGVVDLDDPVSEWVGSAPNLSDITLRQLCDGTSGLGDGRSRMNAQFTATPERKWNPRELAAPGITERGRAGAEVSDSDAAYILLGMALESATGMSAQRLVARYVAGPLDLSETQLPAADAAPAGDPVLPGYVSGDADKKNGCEEPAERTELSASMGFTDSGVTSTISELARYGQSLAVEATDDEGTPRERWAHPLAFGAAEYAGGAYLHGTMIGQQGRMPGYLTSVYADTETGMTVAVVLNNSAGSKNLAAALAKELAAIASKAPATDGREQPQFGLPWTAEQYHETVEEMAVCPIG